MTPKRSLNRRSFMLRVAGGIAAQGGALIAFTRGARALQVTDRDPADPIGRGRGGGAPQGTASGYSDSDSGTGGDPSGHGRRGAPSGVTDSDSGAGADPGGRGRGSAARNAYNDSDNADPAGNARFPPGYGQRGERPWSPIDCPTDRYRVTAIDEQLALANIDDGQIDAMQVGLERIQALNAEMQALPSGQDSLWRRHQIEQEIQGIAGGFGIQCGMQGTTHICGPMLSQKIDTALRLRGARPVLQRERDMLTERIARACPGR